MYERNYRTLAFKLIGITLLFSVVPLLAMSRFFYTQYSWSYNERVGSNLRILVENKKVAIDLFLGEKITYIKTLAETTSFAELSDQDNLLELFRSVQANARDYIDLGVIDDTGRHVAYVGPYDLLNVNYSEEPWFHEVMLKGVYVSDVFRGHRNFPHFIIAIMRREKDTTWILRTTINLDLFNSMVQGVQTGRNGDAYLVNEVMELQTASRFMGPSLTQAVLPVTDRFNGVLLERVGKSRDSRIMGMVWLDSIHWMLVVSQDPSEEMAVLVSTHANAVLLTLAGVLVILAGTLLTTQAQVNKIRQADCEAAKLDATLMHSSKMAALGKLAAGVAHEINNPLTLIRENAGWAKDLLNEEDPAGMANYEDILKSLDMIDNHVERAKDVTQRMLGFGRRMEPMKEDVYLNVLAEQTSRFLSNEAMHRNISIEMAFAQDLPRICTDPVQVQQVILNILDNAIDAVEADGRIVLHTGLDKDGKSVFLSVEDTGPGMTREKLSKIFDPFFTTKQTGEGTGLGLSIVYGILEKLGGWIEAESEVGQGSCFTIHLPVAG